MPDQGTVDYEALANQVRQKAAAPAVTPIPAVTPAAKSPEPDYEGLAEQVRTGNFNADPSKLLFQQPPKTNAPAAPGFAPTATGFLGGLADMGAMMAGPEFAGPMQGANLL